MARTKNPQRCFQGRAGGRGKPNSQILPAVRVSLKLFKDKSSTAKTKKFENQ